MDRALELKIAIDQGNTIDEDYARQALAESALVGRLTKDFVEKPTYAVWRVIALAEIPYAASLDYTKRLIEYIEGSMATPDGFSLYGDSDQLLPCYNSMLLEAYIKLGLDTPSMAAALGWIERYQLFGRDEVCKWAGKGVKKHGGCLRAVPCYIGVAKAAKALAYHCCSLQGNDTPQRDREAKRLLDKAMAYILQHRLYKRLSGDEPIYGHMLDISYPASYQLNIVEMLELAYVTGRIGDPACGDAIEYINSKRLDSGGWKTNHAYKAAGYMQFDKRGGQGDWITYALEKYLGELVI